MADVVFPKYVETFIAATSRYLGTFDVKLEMVTQNPKSQARCYRLSHGYDPVELLVHRTSRSFEQPVGEYRARMNAVVRPELADLLRGFEDRVNRAATLGALVTSERDASVTCQCLIPPDSQDAAAGVLAADFHDTVAGVLAAALVHARASIIAALRRGLNQEPTPAIESLSAWTDDHFEQLQYHYPELDIRRVSVRYWALPLLPHGELALTAIDDNPYWGGGLLFQSRIPERALAGDDRELDVNELNLVANLVDDTPTFGGWCRDTGVIFVQFIPNLLKGLPQVTEISIAWALHRALSARQLVELARESRLRDDG
jgi:hypothetical protein